MGAPYIIIEMLIGANWIESEEDGTRGYNFYVGKCAVSKEIIYGKFIYQFNPIRSAGAVVVENEN